MKRRADTRAIFFDCTAMSRPCWGLLGSIGSSAGTNPASFRANIARETFTRGESDGALKLPYIVFICVSVNLAVPEFMFSSFQ
jgi:hypothetical protein